MEALLHPEGVNQGNRRLWSSAEASEQDEHLISGIMGKRLFSENPHQHLGSLLVQPPHPRRPRRTRELSSSRYPAGIRSFSCGAEAGCDQPLTTAKERDLVEFTVKILKGTSRKDAFQILHLFTATFTRVWSWKWSRSMLTCSNTRRITSRSSQKRLPSHHNRVT